MTQYYSFVKVAVALPVYGSYTYEVPESLAAFISAGKRVLVPFSRRRVTGYVLHPCKKDERYKIRRILDVLDNEPLFPPAMLPFFQWIADYYIHPLGEVIQSALPGGINLSDVLSVSITPEGRKASGDVQLTPTGKDVLDQLQAGAVSLKTLRRKLNQNISHAVIQSLESRGWVQTCRKLKTRSATSRKERFVALKDHRMPEVPSLQLTPKRKELVETVRSQGPVPLKRLRCLFPTASNMIRSLEKAGVLLTYDQTVYRDPFGESIEADRAPELSSEQAAVVATVVESLGQSFRTFLLAGVTGSGKTEVYMRIASETIEQGYDALVLVPEIALISQTARRFRARFGDCVAILHSGLSSGERYDQWLRIARREVRIVIGARSAIFAPLENIGAIIVDEEHDASYKQDSGFRYNARDLAVVRAKFSRAVAILGSATPSIQSLYNVKRNKFTELTLTHRINRRPLPRIELVDLRKQRDNRGIQRFISDVLQAEIRKRLDRNEQVLLFLNRRGFSSFPVCTACGAAIRCRYCDISLTLHKRINAYKCHFCGFTRPSTSTCPDCGSSRIKLLGFGTEKVEDAVHALYPEARVARLDQDTTVRRGALLKTLKELRKGNIDILVGTQMVAKGHDFPNITLVGILCADLSLNFPDFRAGERTFQLLAQVAGRAGRGSRPGRVILQTFNPNHFSILAARNQDFREFYHQEIPFRKALDYPPFSRLIQLKISGRDPDRTREHARMVGERCNEIQREFSEGIGRLDVLGPIESAVPRIAGHYRWQILLKGSDITVLHRFVRGLLFRNKSMFTANQVKVVIDVDPLSMM